MLTIITRALALLAALCLVTVTTRAHSQTSITIQPTANITAVEGTATLATGQLVRSGGFGSVAFQITGTFTGTLAFEGSVDCATYVALNVLPLNSAVAVSSVTTTGAWKASVSGLQCVRVRASAWTSGTAAVFLRGGAAGSSD